MEDERSVKKHIEQLQSEMRKRQRNLSLISDKMKRTADYRMEFCRGNSIANVLNEFPCLQLTSFVSIFVMPNRILIWAIFHKMLNDQCFTQIVCTVLRTTLSSYKVAVIMWCTCWLLISVCGPLYIWANGSLSKLALNRIGEIQWSRT